MSSLQKLIVVFGATGKQGGSVISAILSDKSASSQFRLRGVTRDVSKPASKSLEGKGVEMVSADLNDKASVEKAVQGAYGVFAVTDYWATMDGATEIRQGKGMVDASKAAGVQHFVFSTLLSPKKITNGELSKIEHFETKASVTEYARSSGLPSSFYLPGFFMSNLPGGMLRKDDSSGTYVFALPIDSDAKIPLTDIEADAGQYVKSIFLRRDELLDKEILGAVTYYTPEEVVQAFTKTFPKAGQGAKFVSVPRDAFVGVLKGTGMPDFAAVEMMENMVLLNKQYGYYGNRSLDESNAILTQPATTWEQFLKKTEAFKGLE